MKIKKHSIGYNTVSSVDGVISAKGVKSKPNDIQIFGYTHEVGEGEKSPDNPYTLVSLDSGNVNLYSEDKLSTFIVDSASKAKRKGLSLPTPKSKFYCVHWDNNAKTPIAYKLVNKETTEIGTYQWTRKSTLINVPFGYELLIYDASGNGTTISAFTEKENLMVLDSSMMPDAYISDEHSITLTNNETTIQVPIPFQLNSVEGVSDYIYKDDDGDWKLNQKCQKYEFTGKENFTIQSINTFGIANFITNDLKYKKFSLCVCSHLEQQNTTISNTKNEGIYPVETSSLYLRIHQNRCSTVDALKTYLAEQYHLNVAITLAYYLYTPITHVLSNYAQELLNSFVLENKNNISVEGNPQLSITGYLQNKRGD